MILGMDSYRLVVDRRDALQGVRLSVNMMESEFRTIQDPATDISAISPSAVSFTNDDGIGVTYQFSGSNLLRNSKFLQAMWLPVADFPTIPKIMYLQVIQLRYIALV